MKSITNSPARASAFRCLRQRTQRRPAAEDAGTDNNNSIRIIGAGAAISGCFISLIALLSGGETLVPLTTGIVLTVLGGLIFLTTKNK